MNARQVVKTRYMRSKCLRPDNPHSLGTNRTWTSQIGRHILDVCVYVCVIVLVVVHIRRLFISSVHFVYTPSRPPFLFHLTLSPSVPRSRPRTNHTLPPTSRCPPLRQPPPRTRDLPLALTLPLPTIPSLSIAIPTLPTRLRLLPLPRPALLALPCYSLASDRTSWTSFADLSVITRTARKTFASFAFSFAWDVIAPASPSAGDDEFAVTIAAVDAFAVFRIWLDGSKGRVGHGTRRRRRCRGY